MLVLSRRVDERIMIGRDVVITVLEIHHDHVRLGIDAPRDIEVHREEVLRAIMAANVSASTSSDEGLQQLRSMNRPPQRPRTGPPDRPPRRQGPSGRRTVPRPEPGNERLPREKNPELDS